MAVPASSLNADAYFLRRLSYVRQLQQLPASVQFDLARSPVSDDELDEFSSAYGSPPGQGFGIADVFHEQLSAQPRSIKVDDIKTLQENMKAQGYLPPSYQATGLWDDLSYSAFRRLDRDATDQMRSGKGFLSGALEAGLRTITATLPSFIWQNTVGAAKGIVTQTPEYLESGGLLGGAAAGAAVGTVLAPGVGTLVGAGVGAAAGFFADLFGDEPEEEGQSGWANLVDALTPYEEYKEKGAVRSFFSDLSYIATAASLVSGAKLATGGARAGFGLATGAQAEAAAAGAPIGIGQALLRPTGAGGVGGLLRTGLAHPVATGAAAGAFMSLGGTQLPEGAIDNGDGTWMLEDGSEVEAPDSAGFGDVLEGALWGAAGGFVFRTAVKTIPGWGQGIALARSRMATHNLMTRPIFQMVNKTYSGLARTSATVRVTAGISVEDVKTPLERSIEETDRLETGVDLLGQDLIDWSAALLYPEKFFIGQGNGRALSRAADRLLGNSNITRPIAHVIGQGNSWGQTKAQAWVTEFFARRPDKLTGMWVDASIHNEVIRRLNLQNVPEARNTASYHSLKSAIIRDIKDEAAKSSTGRSQTLADLQARMFNDPEGMEAWLVDTLNPDKPLNKSLQDSVESQEFLAARESELRRQGLLLADTPNSLSQVLMPGPGGTFRYGVQPGAVVVPPGVTRTGESAVDILQARKTVRELEKRIDDTNKLLSKTTDDFIITGKAAERDLIRAQLADAKTRLESLLGGRTTKQRTLDEIHFVAARTDTPTRREIHNYKTQLRKIENEVKTAKKRVGKAKDDVARTAAEQVLSTKKQEFASLVWEGQKREYFLSKLGADARNNSRISKELSNTLETNAAMAARDVDLDPQTMQYLAERGYKPVVTGDEVLFPHDMQLITDLLNVPTYSRAKNVWESLLGSTRYNTEKSLSELLWSYTQSQIQGVLTKYDIPVTAAQAVRLLNRYKQKLNDSSTLEGAGLLTPVTTVVSALKFKADIRRLLPDHIEAALQGVPGITSPVADEIFQAIRRGNAFGGELVLHHPRQSVHLIARAIRTAGLPGFGQVVRSWHAQGFERALKGNVLSQPDLVYNPLTSRERSRVVSQVKTTAAKRGFSEVEVREAERLLDIQATVATSVSPEKFPTVDEFFKRMTVEAADEYVDAIGQLRQVAWVEKKPTINRLEALAKQGIEAKDWWAHSTTAIGEAFGIGRTRLANGDELSDMHLMFQLVAATSPRKAPDQNMRAAVEALLAFKRGEGIDAAVAKLPQGRAIAVREIFEGKTIDKWSAATRADRPVISAKYDTFMGKMNEVVFDSVMARVHGISDTTIANYATTNAVSKDAARALLRERGIEATRNVAQRLGWTAGEVQAAQWVAFKAEAAAHMETLARRAAAHGDLELAKAYRRHITTMKKALTYEDAMKIEPVASMIDEYKLEFGSRLLQRTEDLVRGSINFGDDYQSIIRLYSTGAFDTLVHESGHLLRRIMPESAVAQIEQRYGLRAEIKPVKGYNRVSGDDFVAARAAVPEERQHFLSPYTADEIADMGEAYLSADGKVGFILKNDGEIANVFNVSSQKGAGTDAVRAAIAAGGDRVEYFEGRLGKIYGRLGFEERERFPFDLGQIQGDFPKYSIERFGEPDYVIAHRWSEELEERFADDFTMFLMGKLKGKTGALDHLRDAVATMWYRNREAMLDRGVVEPGLYRQLNKMFEEPLKKAGLWRGRSPIYKQVVAGAAVGATEGLIEGEGVEDVFKGAAIGGAVGLGIRPALKATYGYLPDWLANANLALRYTMSFTFDMGRYVEQNTIAWEKYGLPMFLSPTKKARNTVWERSPYRAGTVTGTTAEQDINRFFDELNGVDWYGRLSENEQRMFQQGMVGFSPRKFEAVQAWEMYQRGWGRDKIYSAVAEIGRYGLGRTNMERSANFIFFPFSFSKKLITTLGDFIGQRPAMNLLITEGMKRYHDSLVDQEFNDFIQERAPILDQLWRVNNLAWGISLGRFFLEGIDDRRTNTGRVAQYLAALFVPSGSATPMQQAIGAMGDLSVNAFVPVVITGESISRAGGIDGLDDIIARYIPIAREIESFSHTIRDQSVALLSSSHRTPWSQFQEFSEQKQALKDSYEPMAAAMGYSTVDGLFGSTMGAGFKDQFDTDVDALRREYPQGFEITTSFENQAAIDEAGLVDLARKVNKTEAEEAFIQLTQNVQSLQFMQQWLPEDMARYVEQSSVRKFASKWADDRRFAELYHRFLERLYGPIRRVA